MVKTLKNLLLRNQKAHDLETWYAASGAWLLPSDIFYGKVKCSLMLSCGKKGKTMNFAETNVVYAISSELADAFN